MTKKLRDALKEARGRKAEQHTVADVLEEAFDELEDAMRKVNKAGQLLKKADFKRLASEAFGITTRIDRLQGEIQTEQHHYDPRSSYR